MTTAERRRLVRRRRLRLQTYQLLTVAVNWGPIYSRYTSAERLTELILITLHG